MRGQRVVVPGLANKLIALLIRLVPRRLLLAAVDSPAEPAQVRAGHIAASRRSHVANAGKALVLDCGARNCAPNRHVEAGPHHPAPGTFLARPRRPGADQARLSARHPPPALRRSAAGDHGRACRRGDLRRPAKRQRHRRFHQARDRLDRRAAARQKAVSRHLPRRADDGAPSRRPRLSASARPCRGRLLSDPPDRRPGARFAPNGRTTSINGIARASICRRAANCWPRAMPFRCRPSATAPATRCSSTRK